MELSIIIPTLNRAPQLRACLDALARQTLDPKQFEVIVVDDGSNETAALALDALESQMPFDIRIFHQPRSGQTTARNRGAGLARGNYFLFLDDDIRATAGLAEAHLAAQRADTRTVGIGALEMKLPAGGDWFVRQFVREWNEHYLHLSTRRATWCDCYSGNLSMPRELFFASGAFATDLPTWFDLEFGYRMEQQGAQFVFLDAARGEHDDFKDAARLLDASEAEGRIAPEIVRRYPELMHTLFGKFWEPPARAIALRRALLRLDAAPAALARAGALLSAPSLGRAAFSALRDYAYWRGVRSQTPRDEWAQIASSTPILMYHAIGAVGERASRFVVPLDKFVRQLEWLAQHKYKFISLRDYACELRQHRLPPARSVIVTFDDGYKDMYTRALPWLEKFRVPATLFVVSGKVGGVNDWDTQGELGGRPLLSTDEIKQLANRGIDFGAHSCTHRAMPDLDDAQVYEEIAGSAAELERLLDMPIRLFAYPFGAAGERVQAIAERAGMIASCTVKRGPNSAETPLQALRRIEVDGTDSPGEFARRIRRGW